MKKGIVLVLLSTSIINAGVQSFFTSKFNEAKDAVASAVDRGIDIFEKGIEIGRNIGEGFLETGQNIIEDPLGGTQEVFENLKKRVENTGSYTFDAFYKGFDTTRTMNALIGEYRKNISQKMVEKKKEALSSKHPWGIPLGMSGETEQTYLQNLQDVTTVSNDPGLNPEEVEFVEKRMRHIKESIGETEYTPKIAFCLSGGGDRAKLAAAGALKGAEETGLIDKTLYISGLSGGTWTMAPRSLGIPIDALIATWKKYSKVPLGTSIVDAARQYPYLNPSSLPTEHCIFPEKVIIGNNFERKFYFDQQIDSMDLWGTFIAHLNLAATDDPTLLDAFNPKDSVTGQLLYPTQSRQRLLFSQAIDHITLSDCASYPMPIGTAVTNLYSRFSNDAIERQKLTESNMLWFEFTPWRVGTRYIGKDGQKKGAFVPLSGFNRQYEKQEESVKSVDYAPEIPLGNLMGTWGSAYTVSPMDILRITGLQDNSNSLLSTIAGVYAKYIPSLFAQSLISLKNMRILPATYFNFAQPSLLPDSPLLGKFLSLVDAGLDFNLPVPSLLEREVDVIVIIDASAGVIKQKDGKLYVGELLKSEEWARVNGLPFPKIAGTPEYQDIPNKAVTIFEGKGNEPTVVYIPLSDPKNDAEFTQAVGDFTIDSCFAAKDCSTFNFNYSEKNIDGVVNFMQQAIIIYQDAINKAIMNKAQQGKSESNKIEALDNLTELLTTY